MMPVEPEPEQDAQQCRNGYRPADDAEKAETGQRIMSSASAGAQLALCFVSYGALERVPGVFFYHTYR